MSTAWPPEHDELLLKIASTDQVDQETKWTELRETIKGKIQQNISLFLSTTQKPDRPAPYVPITTPSGGLKLPPFLPRKQPIISIEPEEPPVSYMTEEQANFLRDSIYVQLDEFDGPPFTIQRLCELCIDPKKHYKSVGKYLRAVEKSLLVTSTWDLFPPLTESELRSSGRSASVLGSTLQSAPSTPLFSPIPFLHDDARRSKSRSPPPTPLTLNPAVPIDEEPLEIKALGLVDELDDPNPGHMSDHPTALTSVTTVGDVLSLPDSKPFITSLEQRFVKAEDQETTLPPTDVSVKQEPASEGSGGVKEESESDAMELDDDKENTKA